MRHLHTIILAVLAAVLLLAGTGEALASGRCYSPEGERIRSFETWLVEHPGSEKAKAISRAVRLYNESRRAEREAHNEKVRQSSSGYLWKELQDPVNMKDLVDRGYHIPVKAWDPHGNLIYDLTSDTSYAGEQYGGKPDPKTRHQKPPKTEKKPDPVTKPPKASTYSPGWQRETGYNFEVPKGAVAPVSTAYAFGAKQGLEDVPGIYLDPLGLPCVKDISGKLRQLFKGSDGYWYAVDDRSIPRDIRYTRGEISIQGPYGSVSFGKSFIDGIAESYGLERSEAKRRLLAYADRYVNTYRNHCRGEAGIVNRKIFLTMDQESFDRKYGQRLAGLTGGQLPETKADPEDTPGPAAGGEPEKVIVYIPEQPAAGPQIKYKKGSEIYLKGRYGSVSMGSSKIDELAAQYGIERQEMKRRILAFAYVYVNTFRFNCKGKTGYVNRKAFLTMDQDEFERDYGKKSDQLMIEQAKYNPPIEQPDKPPVLDEPPVKPPDVVKPPVEPPVEPPVLDEPRERIPDIIPPPPPMVYDDTPPDKPDVSFLGQVRDFIIRGFSFLGFSFGENPAQGLTETESQWLEEKHGSTPVAPDQPRPAVKSPRDLLRK